MKKEGKKNAEHNDSRESDEQGKAPNDRRSTEARSGRTRKRERMK